MYNTCAGTSNFLIIYILTNKSTLTCTVLPLWAQTGRGRGRAAQLLPCHMRNVLPDPRRRRRRGGTRGDSALCGL